MKKILFFDRKTIIGKRVIRIARSKDVYSFIDVILDSPTETLAEDYGVIITPQIREYDSSGNFTYLAKGLKEVRAFFKGLPDV